MTDAQLPDALVVDAAVCNAERVDDEVLVMNVVDGSLFVLQAGAARAWLVLERGVVTASLQDAGAQHADAWHALLGELVERRMLVSCPVDGADVITEPLDAPTFERFDDLADIITLDPVHGVTDAGWPFAGEASAN